jgi:hypothetical protein
VLGRSDANTDTVLISGTGGSLKEHLVDGEGG